jgi:hypothetical protein
MHDGRVIAQGPLDHVLRESALLHSIGLELSEAAEIARLIQQQIPSFPTHFLHVDALCDTIIAYAQPA